MKLQKGILSMCFGLAVCTVTAATASAAATTGYGAATIHWDTINVQTTGGLALQWYDGASYQNGFTAQGSSAEVGGTNAWQTGWDWSTFSGQEHQSTQSAGYGPITATVFSAIPAYNSTALTDLSQLSAQASASAADGNAYSAAADARRWGLFYATGGTGSVTINVDYSLDVVTFDTWSHGGAQVWSNLQYFQNSQDTAGVTVGPELDYIGLMNANSHDSKTGTLSVTYGNFTDGSFGFFEAGAFARAAVDNSYSTSAVPLPGSVLLFGSGLLYCVSARRRKERKV